MASSAFVPPDLVFEDLSGLVNPSDAYTVVSAMPSDMEGVGTDLIESVEITFQVTGRSGFFTVEIPLVGFRIFESGIDLTSEAGIVNSLYGL